MFGMSDEIMGQLDYHSCFDVWDWKYKKFDFDKHPKYWDLLRHALLYCVMKLAGNFILDT